MGGIPVIEKTTVQASSIEAKDIRCPSHAFLKILIPYSRFSSISKTDPEELPAGVFSKCSISKIREFPKIKLRSNELVYFLCFLN